MVPDAPLPAGKLPPTLLASLLEDLISDESVVVGPGVGEDAAVVRAGDGYVVLAMDPVTLSEEPGRFAVQINANDVAVMGATPRWLLASLILPSRATPQDARAIMQQLRASCGEIGAAIVGGHTEISSSVNRAVITACMVGTVEPDRLVTSAGARPGDALLLAGPVAVEGTAILAQEAATRLRECGVPERTLQVGAALLERPGISVLPAVEALTSAVLPHAMHDPTEGGVLTAIREVADASRVGAQVEVERIPVLPACREICDALGLDPLGLLASGSLLAAVGEEDVEPALQALRQAGIESAVVGWMEDGASGLWLTRAGKAEPLSALERDELARWYGGT